MSRRTAVALASLAGAHRLRVSAGDFIAREERPWEALVRLQEETAEQLDQLEGATRRLVASVQAGLAGRREGGFWISA
jgi:hypothetical protein